MNYEWLIHYKRSFCRGDDGDDDADHDEDDDDKERLQTLTVDVKYEVACTLPSAENRL